MVTMLWWQLWEAHNSLVQEQCTSAEDIVGLATSMMQEFNTYGQQKNASITSYGPQSESRLVAHSRWQCSPPVVVIINVDASVDPIDTGMCVIATIVISQF